MAILTRVTGKVFGGNAPLSEIGIFGSAKAQNPTNNQDVATIQSLPAYLLGWGSGVVSGDNFPPMEEVTGVLKTISYQACYLLQEGCPVYDASTEYSNTSIVKNVSGSVLQFYISKQNGNIGHALTDTDWWQLATFTGTSPVGAPQFTMNPNAILPNNCIWLDGSAVSRTDYSTLFSIYGTTYGAGDGSTTFNLPDFRNRYICGTDIDDLFGYVSAGLPNLGLIAVSNGAHTHGGGSLNATGSFKLGTNQNGYPPVANSSASGAFSFSQSTSATKEYEDTGGSVNRAHVTKVNFATNGHWSGATQSNGAHTHSVTSSNSLVGSTTTVKVDGIKVRVYTRFE